MTYLMGVVLFVLVVILKKQTWNFVFSILLNTFLIYLLLILICDGFNIIISTLILSIAILASSIYLNVKNDKSASTSFKLSIILLLLVLVITIPIEFFSSIQGFGLINLDAIEGMQVGSVNFGHLVIAIIIINTIGVVSESSIAISEGIFENYELNEIPDSEIFDSGMKIGNMILKTQLTTLYLNLISIMFPGAIALIRLNYKFIDLINEKTMVVQVLTIVTCMVAVVLTVLMTSYYCSMKLKKEKS